MSRTQVRARKHLTHTNYSSTKYSRAAGIIHLFLSGSGDLPWGFEVQLVDACQRSRVCDSIKGVFLGNWVLILRSLSTSQIQCQQTTKHSGFQSDNRSKHTGLFNQNETQRTIRTQTTQERATFRFGQGPFCSTVHGTKTTHLYTWSGY